MHRGWITYSDYRILMYFVFALLIMLSELPIVSQICVNKTNKNKNTRICTLLNP